MIRVWLFFVLAMMATSTVSAQQAKTLYACLPCGSDCDNQTYTKPGICKHCQMKLVKKSTIQFKNLSQAAVCKALSDTNTIALDVRTPAEFNGTETETFGHIKNAYNIPLQQLKQRMGELNGLKYKQIIVYCSHSHRSPQAAWLLSQNGFKVSNVAGGMSTWENTKACQAWFVPHQ